MSAIYRIALGVVGGLATLALLLSRYRGLALADRVVISLIVVVVAVRFIEPPAKWLLKRHADRQARQLEAMVESVLKALLRQMFDTKAIDPFEVTTTCFAVRRRLLRKVQVPVVRFGLDHRPDLGIRWTQKKGLAGFAMRTHQEVVMDFTPWQAAGAASKDEWSKLPDETRVGFTYLEFRRLAGSVGSGLAVPVLVGATYWGCITIESRSAAVQGLSEILDDARSSAATVSNFVTARRSGLRRRER